MLESISEMAEVRYEELEVLRLEVTNFELLPLN